MRTVSKYDILKQFTTEELKEEINTREFLKELEQMQDE